MMFVYSLINMDFLEEATLILISNFINSISKSIEEKDEYLKKCILGNIKDAKDEQGF